MLEAKSLELGMAGNVYFVGRCSPGGVLAWLQASDVFTLVSSLEGFSCSLVEAMSAGLPAVVSDIPANTQLIEDSVHGLVARLRDERALAAALLRLLTDSSLRRNFGAAARHRVLDHYSMDKVIDLYESLFTEAIGP